MAKNRENKDLVVNAGAQLKAPPAPGGAPAPAAPGVEQAPQKAKRGGHKETYYENAEAVLKARENVVKGPRRAFKVKLNNAELFGKRNGEEFFIIANNDGRAQGATLRKLGVVTEELGKAARAKVPTSFDGIMLAINQLPEKDRAAVMAQLGVKAKP